MKKSPLFLVSIAALSLVASANAGSFKKFKSQKEIIPQSYGSTVCENGLRALENLSSSGVSVQVKGDCHLESEHRASDILVDVLAGIGDAILLPAEGFVCIDPYVDCELFFDTSWHGNEVQALKATIVITSNDKSIAGNDVNFSDEHACQEGLQIVTHLGLSSDEIAVSAHCEGSILKTQFVLP